MKELAQPRRPSLDGVRTIAVYFVLMFHSGVRQFAGGFIGVDIFFVLSGYLVTQVLTRDISGSGSIRFARFYARRFRRLLPAAAVMLIVTGIAYSMIASPQEVTGAIAGFRAAFLYVMNWYLIDQALHGPGFPYSNPAFLFWSLAVEEQFYLVWPVLLGGLFALTRRSARQFEIIRVVIALAALASLTWALVGQYDIQAYYRTDTRAYELLAGALLALTPQLVRVLGRHLAWTNAITAFALGGLVYIATGATNLNTVERGLPATVLASALILGLEAAPGGLVARLLSLPTIVYLGLVSYGIYLWQWPVIQIIRHYAQPNPWQLAVLTALIATGFAALSYQLLERPVRANRLLSRVPRATVAAGLATSVFCALVVVPVVLHPRTHTVPARASHSSNTPPGARALDRTP